MRILVDDFFCCIFLLSSKTLPSRLSLWIKGQTGVVQRMWNMIQASYDRGYVARKCDLCGCNYGLDAVVETLETRDEVKVLNGNLEETLALVQHKMHSSGIERKEIPYQELLEGHMDIIGMRALIEYHIHLHNLTLRGLRMKSWYPSTTSRGY
ncbi:hypothetical protein Lal_00012923 [Lupinus albus]|nr:hypothetical protein Lal_00012923 [Lupinus albus]